ncbi:hypothetical protein ACO0LD_28465 [Undibacterium sp. Ji83W]|uniref:hypothetical protein n=1 Tax=Undibacterium sp. Ji83W TaxID=3413043 RepID=UPI003BF3D2F2
MKTPGLQALPHFLILLMLALLAPTASAATAATAATETAAIFKDKPYNLDLGEIEALDPKPLEISEFSPDGSKQVQGVKIVSKGRIFPFTYEVITFPSPVGSDSAELLKTIKSALDKHEDIILSQLANSKTLGNFLHYFQQVSVQNKPHHVSSNYIFVNGKTTYHIVGTSYGPMVMPREKGWGPPSPDKNADSEAILLLRALRFK